MKISIHQSGSFNKIEKFFRVTIGRDYAFLCEPIVSQGVDKLAQATPRDTGKTATSWSYEIERKYKPMRRMRDFTIWYNNSNIQNGIPVAILLQYGHATGTGGWVEGFDYINPSLKSVEDAIINKVWREVKNS